MIYPEEYKKKVMAAFPGNKAIQDVLENGNVILGRMLDDSARYGNISPKEYIEAYQNETQMKLLYIKCQRVLLIQELYREYWEIRRSQENTR